MLHEHLPQTGRTREDVATDETERLDLRGRGVTVVGPQRELRVARLDLLAGRTSWSFRLMCSCRSPSRLYQMPGKLNAGRGISSSPSVNSRACTTSMAVTLRRVSCLKRLIGSSRVRRSVALI
jgi:hypothetical protein